MTIRHVGSTAAFVAAILLSRGLAEAADLAAVERLYAAASFEDALALLDRDAGAPATAAERSKSQQYRALCLLALRRMDDAAKVVEEMVREAPRSIPGLNEVPPRLASLIASTRQRLAPEIVRDRYRRGYAAYERGEMNTARADFTEVVGLIDDPSLALASQPLLGDLRVLASGFMKLAVPVVPVSPPMTVNAIATAPATQPAAIQSPAPAPAATAAAAGAAIATSLARVVPPTPINQVVPAIPASLIAQLRRDRTGTVEIVIGADGRVQSARMIVPIHPQFDRDLLAATRQWLYTPARLGEVSVPFTKVLTIAPRP